MIVYGGELKSWDELGTVWKMTFGLSLQSGWRWAKVFGAVCVMSGVGAGGGEGVLIYT